MPARVPDEARIGLRLLKAYRGPSPYSDDPCVVAALDLAPALLATGPDRCERVARACSGWFTPPRAAWQASDRELDVAAFVAAWSLAALNKEAGLLRAARAFREDDQICVCVDHHHEQITLAAIKLAAELLEQICTLTPGQIEQTLQAFWGLTRQHHPDFQIAFLMRAARAAGIPFGPYLREHRVWLFGWGRNAGTFFESEPKEDSAIGWKIARDKTASKAIFASLGVPMPPHRLALSEAHLPAASEAIGWPCVVKPAASGRGQGVTTDVDGMEQLTAAFRKAQALGKGPVMIERQVEGDVYRINVVRGRVAVIRRFAVEVTGDGRRTVNELIAAANQRIEERRAAEPYRGSIAVDDKLQAQLGRQGQSLDAVPDAGRKVLLSRTALLARGGSYRDATAEAHPDIATMALMLASSLGLEVCGIDFVSRDISRSCAEEGAVLEINTTPGLRAAEDAGTTAEEIGRQVLGDAVGRIPVALVVVSAADSKRLTETLRFDVGQGWATGDRCGVGAFVLSDPTDTMIAPAARLPDRVARVLRNPLATGLTVVCSQEELSEAGLPIDRYDRVVADSGNLDPAWRAMLERLADRWIEARGMDEVLEHLQPAA